jgi:membrane protease subunit HflK
MYLETVQQVYSNTSKVMIDAKGQGNLLYLPLDKLMAAAGAQAAQMPANEATTTLVPRNAPSGASTTEVPPQLERTPPIDQSGSKGLRSRERGDR